MLNPLDILVDQLCKDTLLSSLQQQQPKNSIKITEVKTKVNIKLKWNKVRNPRIFNIQFTIPLFKYTDIERTLPFFHCIFGIRLRVGDLVYSPLFFFSRKQVGIFL